MEKKLTIFDISENPWEQRWSAAVEILKPLGYEVVVKYIKSNSAELKNQYDLIAKELPDICAVGPSLAEEMTDHLTHTKQNSDLIGAVLLLTKKNGAMWPSLCYEDAVVRAISKNLVQLDLMAPALVAGAGAESRFVIPALARIGFNKISVTDQNAERGEKLVSEFQKKFFNIEFKFVKFETITTLPGVYSLVVNTTTLNLENQVLDELYFFNFLKAQGAVVDLSLIPPLTPLLTEAEEWGARLLSGDVICGLYDSLIFQEALGVQIPLDDYSARLRANATAVPFDLEPYLQRFLDRI